MLLEQLKTQTQQGIQDIQEQIERLHEEQKHLQAYYQQLGSVETAMESAVKQVQTAIALVRKVCPDELENFRNTLNAQFALTPIAELPEVSEPEPVEEEPQPEPEDSGDGEASEAMEASGVSPQPSPILETNGSVNIENLSLKDLQRECLETKGLTKAQIKEYGVLTRKSTWLVAYRDN